MFKLKKACKSCPFRRDAGHAFGFPEPRLREIVNGVAFQCHNTVDYDHWDEGAEARSGDHPQQCAGLMALLHKEGQPNTIMQVAERLGRFDPGALDTSLVYDSIKEAIAAHGDLRRPG